MVAPHDRQATNLDFIDWVDSNRDLVGPVLLAMLAFGFWGFSPLIVDEWPRLDYWQRVAIWISDVTAIALVIPWMFSRAPRRVDRLAGGDQEAEKRSLKWIAGALLLSLSADIGVTAHGIYCERPASERSMETSATVIRVETVTWRQHIARYRLVVRFNDRAGRVHYGLIVFTKKLDGYPPWVDMATRREIEDGSVGFPIDVRYDPLRPARVWAKSEPWNRGDALGYVFAIVHVFQLIVVGSTSLAILLSRDLNPSPNAAWLMPILTLTVQACAIGIVGLGFRIRGF